MTSATLAQEYRHAMGARSGYDFRVLVAVHEAGHVTHALIRNGLPPSGASVIPDGGTAGRVWFTAKAPPAERAVQPLGDVLRDAVGRMASLLAIVQESTGCCDAKLQLLAEEMVLKDAGSQLAGPAAEAVLAGTRGLWFCPEQQTALDLFRLVYPRAIAEDCFQLCWLDTCAQLAQPQAWTRVVAVANALLREGELTGSQLTAIAANAVPLQEVAA